MKKINKFNSSFSVFTLKYNYNPSNLGFTRFYSSKSFSSKTMKKQKWKTRTVYYKRAKFINKFSFLLPMKKIWNRLYKTHLLTKVINSTMSSSLSSKTRFKSIPTDLNTNKSDFILFNKYWNHYTQISQEQLPLWNFKTFNKDILLMRCSYDQFSQEIPQFSSSWNFFKVYFLKAMKILRLMPVIYGLVCLCVIFIYFLPYFWSQQSVIYSGYLFDFYLSQAFYFIWDLYSLPPNTYTATMFQYPAYVFKILLFFELNWVYKGPGYWESFILDEGELFLALLTKTIFYFQYITLNEFVNTWIPERGLFDIMYISRGTYRIYEEFVYLLFIPFLTWKFMPWDISRIINLFFFELYTSTITYNLVSLQSIGGIWNSAYTITLPYSWLTGYFTHSMWLLELKLVDYIKLTIDPQTWFTFLFQMLENRFLLWKFLWYKELLYELNNLLIAYAAFKLIFQELLINFSYYTIKRSFRLLHYYIILEGYQKFFIEIIYNNYIYQFSIFFYTYFYWYSTWYLFKVINIFGKICIFLLKKIFFIDYFSTWWTFFSLKYDLPVVYIVYVIFDETCRFIINLFFKSFNLSGYYFYHKLGDLLLLQWIMYFENNLFFGQWLKLSSIAIRLFSTAFPLYIHDSIILPIFYWTQDLGSLNFYITLKAYNAVLTTLCYPITFIFFDTKWAYPVTNLNMSWRPYNTDWYIPETFWFFKRFGPVFIDHSYILPPYTLLFTSEFFFYSLSFLWNLELLDKPIIETSFWAFDYLEQEWYNSIYVQVVRLDPFDLFDEEVFKYADFDLYHKINVNTPFLSSTIIIREIIFTSVKLTSYLPSNIAQLYWGTLWFFTYNVIGVIDDTYDVIMYENIWEDWFLWIYHSFYFSELRILYLVQDGYIRIEKLKLFLQLYSFNNSRALLKWLDNITNSSIFLPTNEDIFFKSFFNLLNATKTIGFFDNIKDYLFIRDSYGGNLLFILNDIWFTSANNLNTKEMHSSLTVIFWEAFNMWSLEDVNTIESGDSYSMIESLDIHNPIFWGQWFHYQELSEILLHYYWYNWWFRPIFNHWWVRASFQTTRELLRIDHPLWTTAYDRHLWKGFVNYNYNLSYRKGFSMARSLGFKPGFSTGSPVSEILSVGRHSNFLYLGADLLNDVGSFQQKLLMYRNLNTNPMFVLMHNLPKSFHLFLQTMEVGLDQADASKRQHFFRHFSESSSWLARCYHFIFADSFYNFFIFSGLPAGYIDTLQLSNPVINFFVVFKFLEIYFLYFIYFSLLLNIFWEDFLPGHFEAYFVLYFIFFSQYSLINKVFINEYIAMDLFMLFYKLKLFFINIFQPWSFSKWEFWLLKQSYTFFTIWPKSFKEERFLTKLKINTQLEWFLLYYKYIYNITFTALWFEFLLTSYFITEEGFNTSISHYNYILDFHTWKYENTSNIWIKQQRKNALSIIEELNLEYIKPYIYDGYIKLITDFNKFFNKIFVYIRTYFYFFNEDLILKDDYIKSMIFFNLIIEATLYGYKNSKTNSSFLFTKYIMEDQFFHELEIYFTYISFYHSDNYLLFLNPWTNYILEGDFNIYEYVWNKRNVRWHGLPGFWYIFDICYFLIFIGFITIWFLILHSYLRALAKKGDTWFDYIVSIYPDIIQRHKKAYLFKDTFVVDEEAADNILEYYKYYYDSFDYIYLPYRSFKSASLSSFNIQKDPYYTDIDPLTGNPIYLVDFTPLKKSFNNLFSYNSRFLLQKQIYEANRYLKRQRKQKKHTPSLSWYNYKDNYIHHLYKNISWSVWLFFFVFILFFSVEYFFFFKRSWLFNFFFYHKISAYLQALYWNELFFSLNPYFFDGIFSILLLFNLFVLWYVIWIIYFFIYLRFIDWCLLTSNSVKLFYMIILTLLIILVQSLRFWKGKLGFINYLYITISMQLKDKKFNKVLAYNTHWFLDDNPNMGLNIYKNTSLSIAGTVDNIYFLKDLHLTQNIKQTMSFYKNQNKQLINLYLKNFSISDFNIINNLDPSFLAQVNYKYFLKKNNYMLKNIQNELEKTNSINYKTNEGIFSSPLLQFVEKFKEQIKSNFTTNNFYFLDFLMFDKKYSLTVFEKNQGFLKSRLNFERFLEANDSLITYVRNVGQMMAKSRQHNDLSLSFINNFLTKSKQLSIFNKWDVAEFVQMFDDMPLIDRGAPSEIEDPIVPNFLGDQKPQLLDYVEHQWHAQENLYTTDFTNLSQREILERSAKYTGIDNAWYFVDLHNKLDVSAHTGSFFRKQFYEDLKMQKMLRINTKQAWHEADINQGVSFNNQTFNTTVNSFDDKGINKNKTDVEFAGFSDFHTVFYHDYKPATIFNSIQGDNRSDKFVSIKKNKKIIMNDLDSMFDLDYDITNLD